MKLTNRSPKMRDPDSIDRTQHRFTSGVSRVNRWRNEAGRRGLSFSALIEAAVEEYLERTEPKQS